MTEVILAMGSNLGDRWNNLEQAQGLLMNDPAIEVGAAGGVYETSPVDVSAPQSNYLNQLLLINSGHSPADLLQVCQRIEVQLGRPKGHKPGEARTLDIDIIDYGGLVWNTDDIVLPHPRWSQRMFILIPLRELFPLFKDPVSGSSLEEMIQRCKDDSRVSPVFNREDVTC